MGRNVDDGAARRQVELAAQRAHGVLHRADALASGMSIAQIDRRVRRGQWVPGPVHGTLLLSDFADEPISVLAAATSIMGSLAYRESALALWGLVEAPPEPVLVVDRRRNARAVTTVTSSAFERLPSTRRRGIPTVTLETGLCSMASVSTKSDLDMLIDEALRRRLTTIDRVLATVDVLLPTLRRGRRLLEGLRSERSCSQGTPLSDWSRRFSDRLVRSGLERPDLEWRVVTATGELVAQVDLAYPTHRYAIELDSVAFHLDRMAFEEDRRRDLALGQLGWRVDRFTWDLCRTDWALVVRSVRTRLASTRGR